GGSDRGKARAHRKLPGDEGGAAGCAACLGVAIRQEDAFARDPIDVGGRRTHYAAMVGTDVEPAYVIRENQEDVGLLRFRHGGFILRVDVGSPGPLGVVEILKPSGATDFSATKTPSIL